MPFFADTSKLVLGLGYSLVELRVVQLKNQQQVKVVIARQISDSPEGIGVNDCAKVHRVLLPRFEALLQSQDVYMEVTSPGMERIIKNAAEFAVFAGYLVRVWDIERSDWVFGKVLSADSSSLTIQLTDSEGNFTGLNADEAFCIPYTQIAKAKLLYI